MKKKPNILKINYKDEVKKLTNSSIDVIYQIKNDFSQKIKHQKKVIFSTNF